jgi:hypothetical protein
LAKKPWSALSVKHEALPILATVAAQLSAISFVLQLAPLSGQVTFEPVSGTGAPLINAMIFLSLPIAGTLLFLQLRKRAGMKFVYASAESFLVFILTYIILGMAGLGDMISATSGAFAALLGFLAIFRGSALSKTLFAVLISAEAGAFLAIMFTPPTVYLVFLLFAIYDIFAVFRGPLKRVIDDPGFGMLSLEVGAVTMGLGDQIFYSMVPATAYLVRGLQASFISALLVDLGVAATLLLLRRRRALPGLTIPLLFSLLFLLFFP